MRQHLGISERADPFELVQEWRVAADNVAH